MADTEAKPRRVPKVVVVGGGIGGATAALALKKAGADVHVYEQAQEFREIGAGINVQGVAVGVLADLGVGPDALNDPDQGDGIETSSVKYFTPEGLFIAEEPAGIAAGASHPQFSSHRAKLHTTLIEACRRALGSDHLHLDSAFDALQAGPDGVVAHFKNRNGDALPPVQCDVLVGCDGLKSRVRAALLGDARPRYTGRTIFRGVCELPALIADGRSVCNSGNRENPGNFICYPISEGSRRAGGTLCNWALCIPRPDPGAGENWHAGASVEDIRKELSAFDGQILGGLTPLQMAEKTESIIGWALFDRDPLDSFDFGRVTLLGDAAHPLLPFGSQGATQAIMDAEALGIALDRVLASGDDLATATRLYSDWRCEISGKIVLVNREMGPTKVLQMVEERCQGMDKAAKAAWIESEGRALGEEFIQSYRASMPKSVRPKK